jgi:hypothetical protein
MACLDCPMTNIQHKMSSQEACRIIHHVLWQHPSPAPSRNRQASTRTIKQISSIHPITPVPLIYRQTYSCQTRAMSIWLCSTAPNSKIEPLLLALTTTPGQACAASNAICSLFSPRQQPGEAKDEAQEHDSPKSNETEFRADPKRYTHDHARRANNHFLLEWKSHACSAHFPS